MFLHHFPLVMLFSKKKKKKKLDRITGEPELTKSSSPGCTNHTWAFPSLWGESHLALLIGLGKFCFVLSAITYAWAHRLYSQLQPAAALFWWLRNFVSKGSTPLLAYVEHISISKFFGGDWDEIEFQFTFKMLQKAVPSPQQGQTSINLRQEVYRLPSTSLSGLNR